MSDSPVIKTTGPAGPPGPNAVSADGGNIATIGSDSLIYVPSTGGGEGVPTDREVIAGAGLTGGGTLATDITLDAGQGDGIAIGSDVINVDATVVRTSGNQDIYGTKGFYNNVRIRNQDNVGEYFDIYSTDESGRQTLQFAASAPSSQFVLQAKSSGGTSYELSGLSTGDLTWNGYKIAGINGFDGVNIDSADLYDCVVTGSLNLDALAQNASPFVWVNSGGNILKSNYTVTPARNIRNALLAIGQAAGVNLLDLEAILTANGLSAAEANATP